MNRAAFATLAAGVFGLMACLAENARGSEWDIELVSGGTSVGGGTTRAGGSAVQALSRDGGTLLFDRAVPLGSGNFGRELVLRDLRLREDRVLGQWDMPGDVGANRAMRVRALSPDGRWLVIESGQALDPAIEVDSHSFPVVYLYKREDRAFQALSLAHDAPGRGAYGVAHDISDDGRFVAYSMDGPADSTTGNRSWQLYLLDRASDTRNLVSHAWNDPDALSDTLFVGHALLSADGSTVVFESNGTNLTQTPLVGWRRGDIYWWHRPSGERRLLTEPSSGFRGDEFMQLRGLSADGRHVLFETDAPAIVPGVTDTNEGFDVFLYDADEDMARLVSHRSADTTRTDGGGDAQLSDDGSTIIFESFGVHIDPVGISTRPRRFRYNTATRTTSVLPHSQGNAFGPWRPNGTLSGDGTRFVYPVLSLGFPPIGLAEGSYLLTQLAGEPAYGTVAASPFIAHSVYDLVFNDLALSSDGHVLAFTTSVSDIAPNVRDDNGHSDVVIARWRYRIFDGSFELR